MNDRISGFNLYDVAALAVRKWWVGLLCIGLGTSFAAWVAFTANPLYRAESKLSFAQSADQKGVGLSEQLGGLAALAGFSLQGASDHKAEALAILQSRRLADSLVQEKNLLPVLFAERWDPVRHNWKQDVQIPSLWDAYETLSDDVIKLVEDKKTGLITLAVQWTDPMVAVEWNRDLIERANKLLQESAYSVSTRNIAFLKKQLQETDVVGVRQALNNLLESELKNSMLAQRSEDYAFKVLDPAVVPEKRVWPRRGLLIALGLTGGLFAWVIVLALVQIGAGLREEHQRRLGIVEQ